MSVIKLTEEHVKQVFDEKYPIEVDGELYGYHDQVDPEIDDDGQTITIVLKRESDGAFFTTKLYLVRCGYEWYEFEPSMCALEMTEVALVPVTMMQWEPILDKGFHIYETEYPSEGSYCVTENEMKELIETLRSGDNESPDSDFVTILGPAVKTANGWHPIEEWEAN